jgi:hypothetical protein
MPSTPSTATMASTTVAAATASAMPQPDVTRERRASERTSEPEPGRDLASRTPRTTPAPKQTIPMSYPMSGSTLAPQSRSWFCVIAKTWLIQCFSERAKQKTLAPPLVTNSQPVFNPLTRPRRCLCRLCRHQMNVLTMCLSFCSCQNPQSSFLQIPNLTQLSQRKTAICSRCQMIMYPGGADNHRRGYCADGARQIVKKGDNDTLPDWPRRKASLKKELISIQSNSSRRCGRSTRSSW